MHTTEEEQSRASARVDPGLALPLLERVEEAPAGTSGAFLVGRESGGRGMVFVQAGHVCWAVADRMEGRLTDLLIERAQGAVARDQVESLYRECKRADRPLGEALVAADMISTEGLRDALRQHTCEALLKLGQALSGPVRWVPHAHPSYDATFTYRPADILTQLGAMQRGTAAAEHLAELRRQLPEGCPGVVCVRDGGGTPVATSNCDAMGVRELHELCRWLGGPVDIAAAVDPELGLVTLTARDGALLAWPCGGVLFAAICRDPSDLVYVTAKRRRAARERGL